jgi:predicted RNase H-like HicB family nuclease
MQKNKRQFTAVYHKAGKWYVGWVEEIPGVNTQGKTLKELRENLYDALSLVLEVNKMINPFRGKVKREPLTVSL